MDKKADRYPRTGFFRLERQLKSKKEELSVEKAIEIAKTIYAVKVLHPISNEISYATIIKSPEQQKLAKLFNF